MRRRRVPFFSGDAVLHLLLCCANFRAAQSRGHFGGPRFLEPALTHCNLGNRFVDRSIANAFDVGRRKAVVALPSAAWRSRRWCCGI
jgi:hypothetical protein